MKNLLPPNQLRKTYEPEEFKIFAKKIPEHRKAIIGQNRAVEALRFGLGNRAPGFNVYVSAPDGDGKISVIEHFLKELAAKDPIPSDWCYVNNFKDPYCPNALKLPQGTAKAFKEDIETFIAEAKSALVKSLESDEFTKQHNSLKQDLIKKQQEIFSELNEKALEEQFLIKHSPLEVMVIPLRNKEPMTDEDFRSLNETERKALLERREAVQNLLHKAVRESRELEKQVSKQMVELKQKAALFAIKDLLDELLKTYGDIPEIPQYFEDLKTDILDNLYLFLSDDSGKFDPEASIQKRSLHQRYEVNVLVDNSELENAPIIIELNPSYNNLFGKIDRESIMGTLMTNFTLIRAGALHKANGGYLILPVEDLLRSPFSWENLKRALLNQRVEIEDPTEKYGFISSKSLKPEPIPLDVQIILIGHYRLLHLLYQLDNDFKKLFKVKADFDPVMMATEENLQEVCGLIHSICQEEKLLPVSNGAMAKILEHGHRLAAHQNKITTQMSDLADILREAQFYTHAVGEGLIEARHIQKAIREQHHRSALVEEKIKELIRDNIIFIDLEGEKTGQVNGLSVIDMGDILFGRPSRITASVSLGKGGIIDIEREAKMGGAVHTKGVLILSGFLFEKFGLEKPLNLAVRLVFEQSYSGVDGDSASSAELYAILSRLGKIPMRQGIAVTGSVNQKGEIQAVGGINEKIEGFFDVCEQKGFTGKQGVLIPAANQINLMLKEEVLEAVEKDLFKIWAIRTIDEGIEILSGLPAGEPYWDERLEKTIFAEGSVYAKVDEQLQKMTTVMKDFQETKKVDMGI